LGWALVAGRKRVPRPATGKMALVIGDLGEEAMNVNSFDGERADSVMRGVTVSVGRPPDPKHDSPDSGTVGSRCGAVAGRAPRCPLRTRTGGRPGGPDRGLAGLARPGGAAGSSHRRRAAAPCTDAAR